MLSIFISIIVFFIAAWYIRRYLDEQGIPKGMTRGVVILTLASIISWGSAAFISWVQVKIEGPQAAKPSSILPKLLKIPAKPKQ